MENTTFTFEGLRVLTKCVAIEGERFTLIRFRAPETCKDFYGEAIYGLINWKHLDEQGVLKDSLSLGEMAASTTPERAIRRMKDSLICKKWSAEHPDATAEEFMQFALSLSA